MDYMVCVKTADSSATGSIANAKIIHEQSDVGGITDVELYHTYVNTLATDADSTYTDQDFLNQFDPDNFDAGTFTYYFESTIKTSGGTGYAQLWNDTDGSAVTSSEVTTTSTSYERQRSSDISSDMPSTAKTMDTQLKGTASTTASASTSWLIIQVSSLQIPEGILYAIPVMVFFPAIVRWWRERRIAIRH
jgi:hypothetical protein